MAYQIIYKKRFTNKLIRLLHYLEQEWGELTAQKFLTKTDKRIALLKKQPFIGKASALKPDIRSVLITRKNRIYYKITASDVIIINMYDVRQNPKKNIYE